MQLRRVGNSGLRVSALGLGTMTWGGGVDEDDAAAMLLAFHEAGGTLIDTAAAYGGGAAEVMIGQFLADLLPRDEVVLQTKAGVVAAPGGARIDASRGTLLTQLDASLQRLGTDWIDVWHVHAPDSVVPIDETLATLDYAVTSGRVRYVGLTNHAGWQLAGAATWQRAVAGRTPIVAAAHEYSLAARRIEAEVQPAATAHGIGVMACAPLAGGLLTGKYRGSVPADSRAATDTPAGARVRQRIGEVPAGLIDAVATAADGLGSSPLAVSVAWVRDRPSVASVVIGPRTHAQLVAALGSEELTLPAEIASALDDVSAGTAHGAPDSLG